MTYAHAGLATMLALASLSGSASATSPLVLGKGDAGSLNSFPVRALPVLVQVDASGHVTRASPAYALSPRLERLLKQTLSEMISGAAVDKQGKPIRSQFIMTLALDSQPRSDGTLEASFRYLSTQPVPIGRWGWSHIDGRQLALLDLTGTNPARQMPSPDASRGDKRRSPAATPRVTAPARTPMPAAAPAASRPSPGTPGH